MIPGRPPPIIAWNDFTQWNGFFAAHVFWEVSPVQKCVNIFPLNLYSRVNRQNRCETSTKKGSDSLHGNQLKWNFSLCLRTSHVSKGVRRCRSHTGLEVVKYTNLITNTQETEKVAATLHDKQEIHTYIIYIYIYIYLTSLYINVILSY